MVEAPTGTKLQTDTDAWSRNQVKVEPVVSPETKAIRLEVHLYIKGKGTGASALGTLLEDRYCDKIDVSPQRTDNTIIQ